MQAKKGIYKTDMSLKIRTEAHARKMKVISVGTTFMGKYHRTSEDNGKEAGSVKVVKVYTLLISITRHKRVGHKFKA
jgi:hypothetical protein